MTFEVTSKGSSWVVKLAFNMAFPNNKQVVKFTFSNNLVTATIAITKT